MTDLIKQVKKDLRQRLGDGRDVRIRRNGMRGVFDSEVPGAGRIEDLAEDMDRLMEGGSLLKDGGATRVAKVRIGGCDCVIKRYNWRGWVKGIRYMLKGSRARHVWFYGHLLGRIGVMTPRPVCWLEKSRSGIVRQSYIVAEYVEGVELYDYLRNENRTEPERRAILGKMNDLFGKLHAHRITHGDMKRSNILVAGEDICLIDLDATRRHRFGLIHKVRRTRDRRRFSDRMDDVRIFGAGLPESGGIKNTGKGTGTDQ